MFPGSGWPMNFQMCRIDLSQARLIEESGSTHTHPAVDLGFGGSDVGFPLGSMYPDSIYFGLKVLPIVGTLGSKYVLFGTWTH